MKIRTKFLIGSFLVTVIPLITVSVTNNPGMSDLLLFVPIRDIVRFIKIEPLLRAPWIAG